MENAMLRGYFIIRIQDATAQLMFQEEVIQDSTNAGRRTWIRKVHRDSLISKEEEPVQFQDTWYFCVSCAK